MQAEALTPEQPLAKPTYAATWQTGTTKGPAASDKDCPRPYWQLLILFGGTGNDCIHHRWEDTGPAPRKLGGHLACTRTARPPASQHTASVIKDQNSMDLPLTRTLILTGFTSTVFGGETQWEIRRERIQPIDPSLVIFQPGGSGSQQLTGQGNTLPGPSNHRWDLANTRSVQPLAATAARGLETPVPITYPRLETRCLGREAIVSVRR
jgi:hypothetical protein